MADESEKKRKRTALIATLVFHLLMLLIFALFGLTQPVPIPGDGGIEFGWDDSGSGVAIAEYIAATPKVETQPIVEEIPEPEIEEGIVAEEESEVAVPVKPVAKPKPKPAEKPTPKPDPAPEPPKPTISDRLSDALGSLGNTTGESGSQGDKDGSGVQGDPAGQGGGFQGAGNEQGSGYGSGGLAGGGSWHLAGRTMMPGYGTKIKDTREEGIVVLNITVDQSGKVIHATPSLGESTTTSQYLINLAISDVKNNFKYNASSGAAIEQRGKVRFVFQLK